MLLKNKYFRSFILGLQNAMEYRSDFMIGLLSIIFPVIIQVFMWTGIYSSSGAEVMFGYTFAQMITYSVIANIVSRLVLTGFEYEMCDDIKNGGLNKYIVRPVGYFPYRLFCFLGQKAVHLVFSVILLTGSILVLSLKFDYTVTAEGLLGFTASILLAFVLNFIIFYCVGMIAFWLSEIGFFYEAARIVIIAFSGGIFPLDVFGGRALQVLNFMPFRYTINFPVDILNGKITGRDILSGIAVQLLWIVILAAASRLLWNSGAKKYIAVGG